MTLDEQVEFGCRDSKLSPEAEKASEAASRIEKNSDADPTAPVTATSPKAGGTPPVADPPKPPKPASTDNQPAKKRPLIKTSLLVRRRKPLSLRLKVLDKVTQPAEDECHGKRGAFVIRPAFGHRAVTGPGFRSVDTSLAGVRIWPERRCSISVSFDRPARAARGLARRGGLVYSRG